MGCCKYQFFCGAMLRNKMSCVKESQECWYLHCATNKSMSYPGTVVGKQVALVRAECCCITGNLKQEKFQHGQYVIEPVQPVGVNYKDSIRDSARKVKFVLELTSSALLVLKIFFHGHI